MASLEVRSFRYEGFHAEVSRLKENWGWFVAEGVVLGLLGIIAWGGAVYTTIATIVFLGWLLLVGGILHGGHAFFTGSWGGFFLELMTGFLYGIAGLLMISNPGISAMMLTAMIAPLFMVGGLVRLFGALMYRYPEWGWACLSGAVGFVVGVLIWKEMPVSGLWLIGACVGIELFFRGLSLVMFGMRLRRLPRQTELRAAA